MAPQEPDKPDEKQGSQSEAGNMGAIDAVTRESMQQRLTMLRAGAVDIDFQPAKLGSTQLECDNGVVAMIRLKPGTTAASYTSEAELLDQAFETTAVPARIYRSNAGTQEVMVPETYAKDLDVVREQRLQLESNIEDAMRAFSWLGSHPLGSRALPEDIFLIIDALPTTMFMDRVILSGAPNPYDVLYKRKYGNDFVSAADTGQNGTMIFYQRNVDRYLAEEVFHEWAHMLQQHDRQSSTLFDLAAKLERDGYYAREYAKNPGENWAVHLGEQLMGLSGASLWTFAHSAPIRAVVLARALAEAMRQGRNVGNASSRQEEFSERLRMIDTEVLPMARARLGEIATRSKSIDRAEVETLAGPLLRLGWWAGVNACIRNAHDATMLLTFIGTPDDLAGLSHIVKLNLSGIPLRAENLAQLRYLPNLRHLDISYSGLGKVAMHCLAGLPLETLNMVGTGLALTALYPLLCHVKSLRSLDVSNTYLYDNAAPLLAHMTLEYLNVKGTSMSEAVKRSLQESLPHTTVEI
jgi:hypothetical protein